MNGGRAAGRGAARPGSAERTLLRVIVLALFIGDAIAVGFLLSAILEHTASHREKLWFGHTAALALIIVLAVSIALLRRFAVNRAQAGEAQPIPGILIGADNRLSTSKLSAFAWTWVLAWALLSLAFADWVGAHAGWNAFLEQGIKNEYLVLLGGPFVALVGAKALVGNGVANGTVVKLPAEANETTPSHRLAQAFSDDSGQTDLVDTQYLVFGSIALLVFIVMFLRAPGSGLPTLPEALIGLASLAATAYVANKWTAKDAKPSLERIVPDKAKRGATIIVYGANLLTVTVGGKRAPATEQLEVFFGAVAKQLVDPQGPGANASLTGSDHIRLVVPHNVPEGAFQADGKCEVELAVRNAIGVTSDQLPFTIER